MTSWITFRIALRALSKNKMRAGLTVLGVVIGIAAVTTMVSIGQSASQLVQGQFQSLGTNVLVVFPQMQRRGGVRQGAAPTLTAKDAKAIADEAPSVLATSPIVGASAQIIAGNTNWSPREMIGVGEDYLVVRNWPLRRGGFFSERDVQSAAKVCVIGRTIVAKLFQTTNPLGATIRVRNIPFTVIGVLETKGANIVGEDQDDILLMPYTTVQKRLQGSQFNNVGVVLASARSMALMTTAEQEINQIMLERHHIRSGDAADFTVRNTTEIANVLSIVTGSMTLMLASIAGISLVVGGVGIMNTMLVSVTERTREIGIRMAVGARSGNILRQFLVESVVLSCVGGAIGLLLGVGASAGITTLINKISSGADWPMVISMPAAVLALVFAASVGIFFGFYPALKASRLDPIDALRYE
ncbi:MAG: ABC transporter permease [Pirellulales bacterium]|nr:ABC transporter permease [Pirellulales bacterium]